MLVNTNRRSWSTFGENGKELGSGLGRQDWKFGGGTSKAGQG